MRGGIWVLSFFAAAWLAAGVLVGHAPMWWIAVGVAVSAGILAYGSRAGGTPEEQASHVGRVIAIWSTVEGVAMFLAANILINLHRQDILLPVFAIIVGLHMLPLARGIPVRFYYATGAALIALGIVALLAPPVHLPLVTGIVAATILWGSAIGLIKRRR